MTAGFVTPGTHLASTSEYEAGEGTALHGNEIVAVVTGRLLKTDGVISVHPSRELPHMSIGDTVLCEIVKLNEKNGEAFIHAIEGKAGSIQPTHAYGQFFVTGIVDRFLHQTSDAIKRRDICRALVTEVDPVVNLDFRQRSDCGVLFSLCPSCGEELSLHVNGDWNVHCETCDYEGYRALADNFGVGWAELEEGASAFNLGGKRWGAAAEALFAKGPSGRATRIAADVRNDGRSVTYFRFESEGGSGQRPSAPPGCKLFIGGLPRSVGTDELRSLFGEHGEMIDCIVPVDDANQNRGFGFVTYEEKSMADAAIAALDGHRIEGRRIGVREADGDKKGKSAAPPKPQGTKLYIGNLPFKIEESALSELISKHGTLHELILAKGPDGNSKGFAFALVDKGDVSSIIEALNHHPLEGRKLKVDVAQEKNDGKKGGKSSRELRAMREEGHE